MSNWEQQVAGIQKIRASRNLRNEKLYGGRVLLIDLRQQLELLRRKPTDNNAGEIRRLEERIAELVKQLESEKAGIDQQVKDLQIAVSGIYVDLHPRKAVSNLRDNIPFLLLPVRIETRFMTQSQTPELWLRIYPDDIAIFTHETWLTPKEVTNGEQYWKNLFVAEKGTDTANSRREAWSRLATDFGSQRAAWIAWKTKPVNWAAITGIYDVNLLEFPPNQTTTESWSRAPRTNVLPDKFVVNLYEGNTLVNEVVCNPIPDELQVGPDPMNADAAFQMVDNKVVFGEDYNWISNFDKAVAMGMGVKIPLTPEQASRGFKKIVVLGLMLSMDEHESAKEIESLIDNHHYSPNGFSIIKQGTATNNTERDGSGYQSNDPFYENSYYTETGDPLFNEGEEKDGAFLSRGLGINPEKLQYIRNADNHDLRDAMDMNTALYPSTLGYYFDTLLKPGTSNEQQSNLRDFFTRHVTGRGPLPAIRIGNQPYGVLLTSDFSKWAWAGNESYDSKFLGGLLSLMRHYTGLWQSLIGDIAYAGKPGVDPENIMMDILGLQAGSVSFYQRVGLDRDDVFNRTEFLWGGRYNSDFRMWTQQSLLALQFLQSNGAGFPVVDGVTQLPQLLQLIYKHYHNLVDPNNIIEKTPLSERKKLANYDEQAQKNYIYWLYETTSASVLEAQDFGGADKPSATLYQLLRRALLLQVHEASVKWFDKFGIQLTEASGPVTFYNIGQEPTPTKWEIIKAKVSFADAAHPQRNLAVGEYLQTYGINETASSYLKKMKEALLRLSELETAKLERVFTEHMDTCSYRLDAWQTALFKLRLDQQRAAQESRDGIYLGCFGYIEDIRPEPKTIVAGDVSETVRKLAGSEPLYEYINNGGFVHAPSLNHALAAAVLRAGYLNHADSSHPQTLSVNLSSERVRRAMFVLEGVRNGQRLEVLLGYQFERGMHDRASANNSLALLNAYIYEFRDKFLIDQQYVHQQGNGATDTIPANNVVNGLTLAEAGGDYPWGVDVPLNPSPSGLKNAMIAEKDRLADTLDAIKDLFMSEAVYQLVQGNFDRAGAVVTALKDANIPPEFEMVRTPRGSALGYTNRVAIQFENTAVNPWSPVPMTARAKAEPGVNKWIADILGNPGLLTCKVSHKTDGGYSVPLVMAVSVINVQPIDLVYLSTAEFEGRLALEYRSKESVSNETGVKIEYDAFASALPLLEKLKAIFTNCRPLDGGDFLPASVSFVSGSTNDTGDLRTRMVDSGNALKDLLDQLQTIPIIVDGAPDTMGGLYTAAEGEIGLVAIQFDESDNLIALLKQISQWGLPDCFPVAVPSDDSSKRTLVDQAMHVIRELVKALQLFEEKIDEADNAEPVKQTGLYTAAGKLILGAHFTIIPKFTYINGDDVWQSFTDTNLTKYATEVTGMEFPADEWLQQISHVRPRVQDWESLRVLFEMNNPAALPVRPIQMPFRTDDSWLAVEYPAERKPGEPFTIDTDTLSILLHSNNAFDAFGLQSGLLIDEWTESIPVSEEITGIAFNYNQPGSMPPQALLVAVTPQVTGHWSWDDLLGIVNDTFLRAKQRAVEPALLDKQNKPEVDLLLPAILAPFSRYDMDFALDFRMNVASYQDAAPILAATAVNNS